VTDHSSQLLQLGELSRSLRLPKSTTEGYPGRDDDVVRLSPYMAAISTFMALKFVLPDLAGATARFATQTPTPTPTTVPLVRKARRRPPAPLRSRTRDR
jgi:hypothetical protein